MNRTIVRRLRHLYLALSWYRNLRLTRSTWLLPAKTTASGRVTLRASSDPACLSHSRQGLGRLSHDSG